MQNKKKNKKKSLKKHGLSLASKLNVRNFSAVVVDNNNEISFCRLKTKN